MACVLFFLVSLSCSRLIAQTATGSIAGTVLEKSGSVVANAAVTLTNTETNQVRTASTNDRGYYSLPLLPPASYRLSIETPGFSRFVQSDIHLNVGDALTVNPTLQVGQVSQEVTVTGQPSSLETETSSLGQVLSNKTILDLPVNGRNSYSFAALVPGVLASAGFTQTAFDEYNDQFVSINGSRPNQNAFLLDGGMNTQPALSGPGYYPSIDLVQEYKVQTNNFSAEFSNTSGGVINVITKSGSNHLHGSLYEFFRDTGLNANDYFANAAGLARAPFHYNQFGGSVGGPFFTIRHSSFSPTKGCDGLRRSQPQRHFQRWRRGRVISPPRAIRRDKSYPSMTRLPRRRIRRILANSCGRSSPETRFQPAGSILLPRISWVTYHHQTSPETQSREPITSSPTPVLQSPRMNFP